MQQKILGKTSKLDVANFIAGIFFSKEKNIGSDLDYTCTDFA